MTARHTRALGTAAAALCTLLGARAYAGDCVRPTDPAGFAGYAYPAGGARSFDGAAVRVWYTDGGKHAVFPEMGPRGVPVDVVRVAQIADDALSAFAGMGFQKPPQDTSDPSCGSDGGDARLDIYLVDFNAADGQTVPERCVGSKCSSFMLVKANFSGLYATRDEGIRTVVPHELFHAVQNAYDAGMDRFWAEGTAQWAAKTLDPSLQDLERFLPSYFNAADHSLDAPAGSATGSFLYGSAVWPMFLTQRYGTNVVRDVMTTLGDDANKAQVAPTALSSTDFVLGRLPLPMTSTLGDAFATFAAWNAATGKRAPRTVDARYGYMNAAHYPEVPVKAWPDRSGAEGETGTANGAFKGALSGLGAVYAKWPGGATKRLVIDGDPARVVAAVLPLHDGVPALEELGRLPATVTGEAIIVVSARTTLPSDAAFTIRAEAPTSSGGTSSGSSTPPGTTTVIDDTSPAGITRHTVPTESSGGCNSSGSRVFAPASGSWGLLAFAARGVLGARRRRIPGFTSCAPRGLTVVGRRGRQR